MSPFLAALIVFLAAGLVVTGVFLVLRNRENPLWERLRAIVRRVDKQDQAAVLVPGDESRNKVEAVLTKLGRRVVGRREDTTEPTPENSRSATVSAMQLTLLQAGFRRPNAIALLTGAKLAGGLGGLCLVIIAAGVAGPVFIIAAVGFAAFCYVLPGLVVSRIANRRRDTINATLPDALDLLLLCVEAGLGLNAAIARVAEERAGASGKDPIGEELMIVSKELQVGLPRREAFRNLSDRTGVEDVRSLAAQLIQSERLGSSISTALRAQAEHIRIHRRLQAEEQANKVQVKMLLPMVGFIFPSLFIVIMTPTVLAISEVVTKYFSN